MARISTYVLDTSITPNDFLLGSDGDSLNATKNYKVSNLIQQIGSQYNLQSMDLIYTFNAVDSGSVGDGELSTDNYDNVLINASGINSIYVSKLTLFGQLVEEYIETVGGAGLTFTLVDLSNYNNFAIVAVDSVSDVDANTLQLDVTVSVSNGSFSSGKTVGLKLDPAGAEVDLSGYVTLDTAQTITGQKTFTSILTAPTNSRIKGNLYVATLDVTDNSLGTNNINMGNGSGFGGTNVTNRIYFNDGKLGWQKIGQGAVGAEFDNSNTDFRTYTFQDKDGTLAHLDDIQTETTVSTTVSPTLSTQEVFASTPSTFTFESYRFGNNYTFNALASGTTVALTNGSEYVIQGNFSIPSVVAATSFAGNIAVLSSGNLIPVGGFVVINGLSSSSNVTFYVKVKAITTTTSAASIRITGSIFLE